MKNYTFYAVEDEKGIVSIRNDKFTTLKAIFSCRADADDCVRTSSVAGLKVVPVVIAMDKK